MNIICDLDGTIALDTGRAHFLHMNAECPKKAFPNDHTAKCVCLPGQRDWKHYFDACDTDEPCRAVTAIIEAVGSLIVQPKIWILSGRSMSVHQKTIEWLSKHHVPYDFLQMRAVDCREDDHTLKLRWARELDLTPQNTLFVLEDRQRVVEAWRSAGYRCFQVADGNF